MCEAEERVRGLQHQEFNSLWDLQYILYSLCHLETIKDYRNFDIVWKIFFSLCRRHLRRRCGGNHNDLFRKMQSVGDALYNWFITTKLYRLQHVCAIVSHTCINYRLINKYQTTPCCNIKQNPSFSDYVITYATWDNFLTLIWEWYLRTSKKVLILFLSFFNGRAGRVKWKVTWSRTIDRDQTSACNDNNVLEPVYEAQVYPSYHHDGCIYRTY